MEHEYQRCGALAYLAAWDVHRAKLFGRCEEHSGIAAFDRLVEQFMAEQPYASARRVFLIMDNGSSHRGARCIERLRRQWSTIIPVHLPTHASWLDQVEIYFSILQRKALTPNDFPSLDVLAQALLDFQQRYESVAKSFEWKFTRQDLSEFLAKLSVKHKAA